MACCESSMLIDRTREVKKAADGIIHFIQDHGGGKQLIEIFGLPIVGKTSLGMQICERVNEFLVENGISHRRIMGCYCDSSRTYALRDRNASIRFQGFSDLEQQFILSPSVTFLVFLDDLCDPESTDRLMHHQNCCIVLTTRRKMQMTRWAPRVHCLQLTTLAADESKNYMCKHLHPDYWAYRLNQISQNCQGFPGLLRTVTKALLDESVLPEDIYQLSFLELCRKFLPLGAREVYTSFLTHVRSVDRVVPEIYIPSLVIMRGSFGSHDAATLSRLSRGKTKKALIEPLFNLAIVSRHCRPDSDSFVISGIIQSLLEESYSYLQNDSDLHNRFCKYFAKIFSDLHTKILTDTDEFFPIFLGVYPNILALVEKAVYCLKEEYDVLINIGRQAQLIMMYFLQVRDVVTFYEACAAAAKERGNEADYARMLSALGHSLLVIAPDIDTAGGMIWEAHDMMKKDPNICPTEIALTTSHKAHYYYLRGDAATSMRYLKEALSICDKLYDNLSDRSTPDEDDAKVRFLIHLQLRIKSNIAMAAGCLGRYDYSIKLHEENIKTYREVFKSDMGMGGRTYHYISLMLHFKGDEKSSSKYSRIGLDIERRSQSNRPSLSLVYSTIHAGMGYFYAERRDATRALIYLDDALAMIENLESNHADRSLILHHKGTIYLGTGNYIRAEEMFRQAAEIRIREYGIAAYCGSGETLQNLGEAYCHLEDYGKAVNTFRKCLYLELEYYKQSPVAFEGRILKTLEWLKKSLVEEDGGGSKVAFVDEFLTGVRVLMGTLKVQNPGVPCGTARKELNSIIKAARTELDLGAFQYILART